ncbi:hypothetical protein GEMRC1_009363 [Eukaryota sp. GEM-RC1]
MSNLELEHVIGSTAVHHKSVALTHDASAYVYPVAATLVTCRVDDPHTQERFSYHQHPISHIKLSPQLIASSSISEHFPRDPPCYTRPIKLGDIGKGLSALAFSPDYRFLTCCLLDGTIQIFDLSNGDLACAVRPKSDHPASFCVFDTNYSPNNSYNILIALGQSLLSGSFVFDRASFSFRLTLSHVSLPSLRRDFSCAAAADQYFFLATTAGEVVVLGIPSLNIVTVVSLGVNIPSLFASPFSDSIAVALTSSGEILKLSPSQQASQWASNKLSSTKTFPSLIGDLQGSTMLTITSSNSIFSHSLSSSNFTSALLQESHTAELTCTTLSLPMLQVESVSGPSPLTLSLVKQLSTVPSPACPSPPSSACIFLGTNDGYVYCLEYPSLVVLWSKAAHRGKVKSIATPVDGLFVATAGEDSVIRIFGKNISGIVSQLECHTAPVSSIIFDCEDKYVIHSAAEDRCLVSSDVRTGKRKTSHFLSDARFTFLSQLVDGERELVSIDTSKRILLHDVDISPSVGEVYKKQGNSPAPVCLKASHKGRAVVVGLNDGNLKVFEIEFIDTSTLSVRGSPNAQRGSLAGESNQGHVGSVTDVCWTLDDKQVISVGHDCSIYVWNYFKNI